MSFNVKATTPSSSGTYPLGDMTNSPNADSPYKFRPLTKKQSQASKASFRTPVKSRSVIPIDKTGSLIRGAHDCRLVNTAITTDKAFARQVHSLSRFALASSFNCKTERRKTHLNGNRSSCGGCQSAHAALSCKLNDDILQLAVEQLKTKKFSELPVNYQRYLTARFGKNLTPTLLASKIKKLSEPQKRSSFMGTAIELERAGTYPNPISSNRFDIYLETTLRPFEDQLAEKCRKGELTPTEALEQLRTKYRQLIHDAIDHLNTDLDKLDELETAWNDMIDKQKSGDFEAYLPTVDRYLKAFAARFKNRLSGTPRLGSFKKYLVAAQSRQVLTELNKNKDPLFFELNARHLKIPTDSEKQFRKARADVERRLTEASYQLDGITNTTSEKILKYAYGKVDKDGIVQVPDKERIAEVFCSVFPSR